MHEELRRLYAEDQEDRRVNPLPANLIERDRARRRRVGELLDAGAAQTGEDFFHAAMVFQHGEALEDYLRAHELALGASGLGYRRGRWLAAAAYDRWLVNQGRPQKYGTQYRARGDTWELSEVDPETTDAERAEWDVPSLAEAQRRADEMTASRPPQRPGAVRPPLTGFEPVAIHRLCDFEVQVIPMPPGLPTGLPRPFPAKEDNPVPWLPVGLTAGTLGHGFGAAVGEGGEAEIAWRPCPDDAPVFVGWPEEDGPPPAPELVAIATEGCAISWQGAAGWTVVAMSRPNGQRWMVIGNHPRDELLRVAESLPGH